MYSVRTTTTLFFLLITAKDACATREGVATSALTQDDQQTLAGHNANLSTGLLANVSAMNEMSSKAAIGQARADAGPTYDFTVIFNLAHFMEQLMLQDTAKKMQRVMEGMIIPGRFEMTPTRVIAAGSHIQDFKVAAVEIGADGSGPPRMSRTETHLKIIIPMMKATIHSGYSINPAPTGPTQRGQIECMAAGGGLVMEIPSLGMGRAKCSFDQSFAMEITKVDNSFVGSETIPILKGMVEWLMPPLMGSTMAGPAVRSMMYSVEDGLCKSILGR
mmetsp:Transcript_102876/g.300147  ORF Transcript_102876/g.300147 Transcript_102876/m.300147 type:complete len:275 (-) Transcript_102876:108-932(-)